MHGWQSSRSVVLVLLIAVNNTSLASYLYLNVLVERTVVHWSPTVCIIWLNYCIGYSVVRWRFAYVNIHKVQDLSCIIVWSLSPEWAESGGQTVSLYTETISSGTDICNIEQYLEKYRDKNGQIQDFGNCQAYVPTAPASATCPDTQSEQTGRFAPVSCRRCYILKQQEINAKQ